ncbi:Gfo/Idh/MocA family protein [Roseicitreum antarcticum]|uniref:Predicted dehydrogenase n=1 Tax=Roseicitreum antarcticum TaxID=564137 RepID=A0A1H3D8A6_9RHOB|nr:Gfo/Idh/MocA family oxidoreductase [Roseicitreum antarcticum]SDX62631.1 Predicted dehydrogenase [Roseicitreum antarcticum]
MTSTIRWGILGAAKIAQTQVAPAIQAARDATLAALATSTPAKAAPFAALAPGLTVHDSYDALLADPDIDAIYIPLPNHLHIEWTLKAIAAGKHVLCEKPIALQTAEIDQLIAARDAAGVVVAEAFMVANHPQLHKVRALLDAGAIGRLCHIEGAFTYNNPDPANIRNNAEAGGGGLRDIGVYPCITARLATGQEPTALRADIQYEGGVDTFARVWADFDGFTMSFYCGMRQGRYQHMLFHGSDGWISLSAPFNAQAYGDCRVEWQEADGITRIERFNSTAQYTDMIEAFGDAIRTGAPLACPLEVSRGNQAMIDGIFAAGDA